MTLDPLAAAALASCRRAVEEAREARRPTGRTRTPVPDPPTADVEPWVREPDDPDGPGDPWEDV